MDKKTVALAVGFFVLVFGGQWIYTSTRGKALAEARAAEAKEAEVARKAAEARMEAQTRAVEGAATSRAVGAGVGEAPPPAPAPVRRLDARPAVESADERIEVLENDRLRLEFSNVGATLRKAVLVNFNRVAGKDEPLDLLRRYPGTAHAFELKNLEDPGAYAAEQPWNVRRENADTLVFTLEAGVGTFNRPYRVEKKVTLRRDAPLIDVAFSFEHFGDAASVEGTAHEQHWRFTPASGIALDGEVQGTEDTGVLHSVVFQVDAAGVEEYKSYLLSQLSGIEHRNDEKLRAEKYNLGGTRRFTADLNSYFGVFTALTDMPSVNASLVAIEDPTATGSRYGKPRRSRTDLEFRVRPKKGAAPVVHGLTVYVGPIDEKEIDSRIKPEEAPFVVDFKRVYKESLGFWGWIGRAVLGLLHFLHGITGDWGWAIVLMTCCVRFVLFPINKRSQIAMRKYGEGMARIKPELERLKEKYKDNAQKFGAEQMALMRREKVSMVPLGGCLPLFLQIPVFYGLFSGLRSALDLRQAPFLWVKDLSQPDHLVTFSTPVMNPMKWFESCTCCVPPGMSDTISGLHLLPLLMTAAWIVNQMAMPKPANETPQMAQQRKMMLVMPFVFGFTMYGYAAALSLYWLTSSLFGIVESKFIKREIDRRAKAAVLAK